jgi:hypothetical protein
LLNANYGEFNTGYIQWFFQAKDTQLDCTETVILTKTDGSGLDLVNIHVKKGSCEVKECEEGKIQNLDLDSCLCEPLHAHHGELFTITPES